MGDLTVERVVEIHNTIIDDKTGDCHVLSEANLLQMVFYANLIPDCVLRAAFIFYSLSAYPAFREASTETALAVTEHVLASGGYRITGDRAGIMALAKGVIAFMTELEEIEEWFRKNTMIAVSG